MNNNINPHLYNAYLHLKDTLNAKIVHCRKRKTANSIEIVFLCDAINALSGHINTLKEAEACGFWIVCRRQTGKKHAFYHGLPVFQLFLTPVHPKKALENKIQAAQRAEEITFEPISTHKRKHKIHFTPYTLHPEKTRMRLRRVRQLVAMVHTTPLNGQAPNVSALRSDYHSVSSPPESFFMPHLCKHDRLISASKIKNNILFRRYFR